MTDNRNLLIALALSMLLFGAWEYFVGNPQMKAEQAQKAAAAHHVAQPAEPQMPAALPAHLSYKEALAQGGPRIAIASDTVDGSLRLKGAVFDDLRLRHYHVTVDPKSPEIDLLAPQKSEHPYYTVFGFVAAPGAKVAVPDANTPWKQVGAGALSPGHPVTLAWNNGQGLTFTRTIALDDRYMFTVTDRVANDSGRAVTLYPYAYVARDGLPAESRSRYLHEGFVGVSDNTLKESDYDDFKKDGTPPKTFASTGGWVGITDKYWMAAVIPPQDARFDGAYRAAPYGDTKAYQADYRLGARAVAPGATLTVTERLFAGAKVVDTLRQYEHKLDIQRFDLAVDWGWFIFFTQPLFWVLDQFYHLLGNFGLAILAVTVCLRIVLFPLANAGFKSMSKMKKVQPQMEAIKKRFADDPKRQQQEVMELYKREKVNPVSGCLPMVIQIPILFSLYKVLYVTIEMYHAPFYGWIHDLSAPDPTSIINLFGLLPYSVPHFIPAFLSIGIWPVLMGMTQWVQTKMNPASGDPMQQKMFALMPVVMTCLFAAFPAGLVIYYTWNNLLSVTQQYIIMKRQGVPVHLIENLRPPAFLKRLTRPARNEAGE